MRQANRGFAALARGLRGFAREQRGVVALTTAIAALVLLPVCALAIDLGYAYVIRARLQTAVDAAAVAAGSSLDDPTAARNLAVQFFNKNVANSDVTAVLRASDVVFGTWDTERRAFRPGGATADAVRVTARLRKADGSEVDTFFARSFGVNWLDLSTQAVATNAQRGAEVALVLDVSNSMNDGGKIATLREAATDLVNILYGAAETQPNLWVGMAPFNSRVNNRTYAEPWLEDDEQAGAAGACLALRDKPARNDDTPPKKAKFKKWDGQCPATPTLGLTAEKTTISKAIAGLTADGCTATQEGMAWGWRILSPNWRGLWGNAEMPLDYRTTRMDKVAIIMTDGANTPWCVGDPFTVEEADAQLRETCAAMKQEGITIYTITFQAPHTIKTLYQGCATSPAHWFDAPTNEELKGVFSAIGKTLRAARLVQ